LHLSACWINEKELALLAPDGKGIILPGVKRAFDMRILHFNFPYLMNKRLK
jgi:hypothetical protein